MKQDSPKRKARRAKASSTSAKADQINEKQPAIARNSKKCVGLSSIKDSLKELRSLTSTVEDTKREIRAKEFAIELLQQQTILHQVKALQNNKTFVRNARHFLSRYAQSFLGKQEKGSGDVESAPKTSVES